MKQELRCPELNVVRYPNLTVCKVDNQPCLVEQGYSCSYYDNYFKELGEEGLDEATLIHYHKFNQGK